MNAAADFDWLSASPWTITLATGAGGATGGAAGATGPAGGGSAWIPGDGVQPAAGDATTGQSGPSGPSQAAPSMFQGGFIWIMLGMIVIMLVVSTIGPRRERKRRDEMLGALQKHDKVQTTGGVIGSIVELKPDTVVLKVDESSNTRITFSRASIQVVLSSRGAPGEVADIGDEKP
jgi:preprotein translocase subunit YajC